MKHVWLILLFFVIASASFADTTYVAGGNVSGEWSIDGSPYIVQGNINVAFQDTLSIGPGVRVEFIWPYALSVNGYFSALGTPADSIVFTNYPAGDSLLWGGINLQGGVSRLVQLNYCVFENTSYWTASYAALNVSAADVQLWHSTVRNCEMFGIRVLNSTFAMTESDVANCGVHSCGGYGGALVVGINSQATVSDSRFLNNDSGDGGAIEVYQSAVVIERCLFDADSGCSTGWGGAIFADGSATDLTVRNSVFRYCSASCGGAIAFGDSPHILVDRCVFYDNVASAYGGGICCINSGINVTVRNCTFAFNRSLASYGGALRGQFGEISNCIFAYHESPAINFYSGCPVHHNSFFGNTCNVNGPQPPGIGLVDRINARGDSCDRYYNIFALDPLLADTSARDFQLLSESPCIDAGDTAAPRDPDSTIADIGAMFYPQPQAVADPFIASPSWFVVSAYPNPFNATACIRLTVPQATNVRLTVCNLIGERVAVLWDQATPAGVHSVIWNAASASSGTYFAVLDAGEFHHVQKLLLLR